MVAMLVGAVLCDAGITALLTSLIDGWDSQAGTNKRRLECVEAFMEYKQYDAALFDGILVYYQYKTLQMKDLDEDLILGELSPSIRHEILNHLCYEKISKIPVMATLSKGFLKAAIGEMYPFLAMPRDKLITAGKVPSHMFFLLRGRCVVSKELDVTGSESAHARGNSQGNLIKRKGGRGRRASRVLFILPGSVIGHFEVAKETLEAVSVCELLVMDTVSFKYMLDYASKAASPSVASRQSMQRMSLQLSRTAISLQKSFRKTPSFHLPQFNATQEMSRQDSQSLAVMHALNSRTTGTLSSGHDDDVAAKYRSSNLLAKPGGADFTLHEVEDEGSDDDDDGDDFVAKSHGAQMELANDDSKETDFDREMLVKDGEEKEVEIDTQTGEIVVKDEGDSPPELPKFTIMAGHSWKSPKRMQKSAAVSPA